MAIRLINRGWYADQAGEPAATYSSSGGTVSLTGKVRHFSPHGNRARCGMTPSTSTPDGIRSGSG